MRAATCPASGGGRACNADYGTVWAAGEVCRYTSLTR